MSESELKVTDKRMFTPDGELREEYRSVAEEGSGETPSSASPAAETSPPVETPPVETASEPPAAAEPSAEDFSAPEGVPLPEGPPELVDLIDLLAQPILIYLGDLPMPDGQSLQNLPLARRHIDLLELLQTKTEGNRSAQESALLDDLLYRLRMRYVQKSG